MVHFRRRAKREYNDYYSPSYNNQNRYYNSTASKPSTRQNLKRLFYGIIGIVGAPLLGSKYYGASYTTEKSYESEQQRISRRLQLNDLQVRTNIIGDGNCQFRAIADQIYGNQNLYQQVRYDIVNWLSRHPSFYVDDQKTARLKDFLDTDRYPTWGHYIRYMSRDRAWGDEFTLIAASQIYNVNVFILSSVVSKNDKDAVRVLYPQTQKRAAGTIFLLHWHEKHFDSLEKIKHDSQ